MTVVMMVAKDENDYGMLVLMIGTIEYPCINHRNYMELL